MGKDILAPDGSLDRKKLAEIVFSDPKRLRILEAIIHPAIEKLRKHKSAILRERGHKVAVYMAPLIFETNLNKELDKVILITAKPDIAMKRAQIRDLLTEVEIQKRIDQQLDEQSKIKMADYVIENNSSFDELFQKVAMAWKKLTGFALS